MKHKNAIFIPVILAITTLIFSCGSDSNSSGPTFEPGMNFIGTYQVQPDPYTDPVVDTFYFEFRSPNVFFMRLLTNSYLSGVDSIRLNGELNTDGVIEIAGDTIIDNDRTYCDMRNIAYQFVTYTDSIIITVPSNYNYLETCNQDYNPGDSFRYSIQGNDIILFGSDNAIRRRIILWAENTIRIYN